MKEKRNSILPLPGKNEREGRRMLEEESSVSSFASSNSENESDDHLTNEEEEETQEDREFINDDGDGENSHSSSTPSDSDSDDDQQQKQSRKKRKRPANEFSSDLDEDDLELIAENIGRSKVSGGSKKNQFRRLVSKSSQQPTSTSFRTGEESDLHERNVSKLENLFDEKQELEIGGSEEEEGEEDDLEDFIVYDDSLEKPSISHPSKQEERVIKREKVTEKKTKKQLGISSNAWQDIQSIFGDGTDYSYAFVEPTTKQQQQQESNEIIEGDHHHQEKSLYEKLKNQFEPSLLAKKMYTSHDERLRQTDIPERMLTRQRPVKAPRNEEELREESLWVSNQILLLQKQSRPSASDESFLRSLVKSILGVLTLIREENMEVPFIATHRKEFCDGVLNLDDLWLIYDLDEKWSSFLERRLKIQRTIETLKETATPSSDNFLSIINEFVENASNESELLNVQKGIESFFNFYKSSIASFVDQFCIQSCEFGKSLLTPSHSLSLPNEPIGSVEQEAMNFLSSSSHLSTVDQLLDEVVQQTSLLISSDPLIKRWIDRKSRITLTTTPTEQGKREIDVFHEFYPIKYLTSKPLDTFYNQNEFGQFLLIEKASNTNFITISYQLEDELEESFVSPFLFPDPSSLWNGLREKILKRALHNFLIPGAIENAKNMLHTRSVDWLQSVVQSGMQERLMVAPVSLSPSIDTSFLSPDNNNNNTGNDSDTWSVFGVSFGKGDYKSFVHVSVVDNLCRTIHQECWSSKSDYIQPFNELIDRFRPIAIGVGGLSIATRRLYDGIRMVALSIPVFYVVDDTSRIEMMATDDSLYSYCSSLARKLIFPLYEYARLYDTNSDSLSSLLLHPLQPFFLTSSQSLSIIERALINVVNLVGVDFNLCTNGKHFSSFHVLQFICGLGKRKAHWIKEQVFQEGICIAKRTDLVGLFGKKVYANCASFLRIDPKFVTPADSVGNGAMAEPLDVTRIHPESYYIARKMAANALDVEESPEDDIYNQGVLVEEVMEHAEKLDELDLDGFARELERVHSVLKHITLQDIKLELQSPFKVSSFISFSGATEDEVFQMLTGESDATLHPGLLVSGTVGKIIEGKMLFLRFESGITGILPFRNIPTDFPLKANEPMVVRIVSVAKDRFSIDVTCKPEDLKPILSNSPDNLSELVDRSVVEMFSGSFCSPDQLYFDYGRERQDLEVVAQQDRKHQQALNASRLISHSSYRAWPRAQVEKWLDENGTIGDFLFRPSSKGTDHLTLTIKLSPFPNHRFVHWDIREGSGDSGHLPISRSTSLSTSLSIGNEVYGNLDEIIDRMIHPFMDYINEVFYHPKYFNLNEGREQEEEEKGNQERNYKDDDQRINTHLMDQKTNDPTRIPYCLSEVTDKPGYFQLAFIPGTKSLRKEIFSVQSKGFKMHGECFENLSDLINWFKRHCSK